MKKILTATLLILWTSLTSAQEVKLTVQEQKELFQSYLNQAYEAGRKDGWYASLKESHDTIIDICSTAGSLVLTDPVTKRETQLMCQTPTYQFKVQQ